MSKRREKNPLTTLIDVTELPDDDIDVAVCAAISFYKPEYESELIKLLISKSRDVAVLALEVFAEVPDYSRELLDAAIRAGVATWDLDRANVLDGMLSFTSKLDADHILFALNTIDDDLEISRWRVISIIRLVSRAELIRAILKIEDETKKREHEKGLFVLQKASTEFRKLIKGYRDHSENKILSLYYGAALIVAARNGGRVVEPVGPCSRELSDILFDCRRVAKIHSRNIRRP